MVPRWTSSWALTSRRLAASPSRSSLFSHALVRAPLSRRPGTDRLRGLSCRVPFGWRRQRRSSRVHAWLRRCVLARPQVTRPRHGCRRDPLCPFEDSLKQPVHVGQAERLHALDGARCGVVARRPPHQRGTIPVGGRQQDALRVCRCVKCGKYRVLSRFAPDVTDGSFAIALLGNCLQRTPYLQRPAKGTFQEACSHAYQMCVQVVS